jgi:hypothetical protein
MGATLIGTIVFCVAAWATIAGTHRLIASRGFMALIDRIMEAIVYPYGKP